MSLFDLFKRISGSAPEEDLDIRSMIEGSIARDNAVLANPSPEMPDLNAIAQEAANDIRQAPPPAMGNIPTAGSVATALGIGALGLGTGVTIGNKALNPFGNENPLDVQTDDIVPALGGAGTFATGKLLEALNPRTPDPQEDLNNTLNPTDGESAKEHIARITGSSAMDPKMASNIFDEIKSTDPRVGGAVNQGIKETLGVSIEDITSRKDIKMMDELLNKTQEVQTGREARRPVIDERVRQLQSKVANPESMSKGEKAAFIIAAALPVVAAAISKKRLNPQGIQALAQAASAREAQIAQTNQQNFENLLDAEKHLDEFDMRSIQAFQEQAKLVGQRSQRRSEEQDLISQALENVEKTANETSDGPSIFSAKVSQQEKNAAAATLKAEQANRRLNTMENKFADELTSSSSRFARFRLSNYAQVVDGRLEVQIPNEGIPPEIRRALGAQLDIMLTVLRDESGATISTGEFAQFEENFFIFPGDDPETIAQKRAFRRGAISKAESRSSPEAMAQSRMVFAEGLIKEPLKNMGGRIETRLDSRGNVHKFVVLKDPSTGKVKTAKINDFAEILLNNGVFDGDNKDELDSLLRGL